MGNVYFVRKLMNNLTNVYFKRCIKKGNIKKHETEIFL